MSNLPSSCSSRTTPTRRAWSARELVPLGELFVIPLARAGQYRLRVIFGEFPSRAAAIEAGKRLPPRYQQAFRASPRSFAELRGQI